MAAFGIVGLTEPSEAGAATYWIESRPAEGGRSVLVRLAEGETTELTAPWSVRSRVHEYGGAPYLATQDAVFFVDDSGQRVWRWDPSAGGPSALTGPSDPPRSTRWADLHLVPGGRWLVGVRETHSGAGVANELVALATDGSGRQKLLFGKSDFVASPALSPLGDQICWMSWDHPQMPWESSRLWLASLDAEANLGEARVVAGGEGESVCQPCFDAAARLHFVSDASGWWNLYRLGAQGPVALAPMEAELAAPQWVFGDGRYCFLGEAEILTSHTSAGRDRLGIVSEKGWTPIETPEWSAFSHLRAAAGGALAVVGGPRSPTSVIRLHVGEGRAEVEVLASSFDAALGGVGRDSIWSVPESIDFPAGPARSAHALYYPAHNPDFLPEQGELPPLLVMSHGGPTSAFRPLLDPVGVQYFTTRGIAVVQVNYTGSSGYGRSFREALRGLWGVADVEDCVAAAEYLVRRGEVDGSRLFIRGSSAGGYTTLCAAVFTDRFAAGASYYGIGDPAALARSTHKFEAHYLDSLIGPLPSAAPTYRERSPALHAERLSTPLALFQGAEDAVVPPEQAEAMAAALAARGIDHVHLVFEGEGHGFRKAETKQRCLEAELALYGRAGGFEPIP